MVHWMAFSFGISLLSVCDHGALAARDRTLFVLSVQLKEGVKQCNQENLDEIANKIYILSNVLISQEYNIPSMNNTINVMRVYYHDLRGKIEGLSCVGDDLLLVLLRLDALLYTTNCSTYLQGSDQS